MSDSQPTKNVLKETEQWFVEAVREPTNDNRIVQLGVHFEEVAEMFEALGPDLAPIAEALQSVGKAFKAKDIEGLELIIDRKKLLDALCDQIVTAVGVGHMFNLDVVGAMDEVNRSNYSKFVDGRAIFDENGKIKKGPNYSKAVLEPFIGTEPV